MFNVLLTYANGKTETLHAHHVETIEGEILLIEGDTFFRRIHRSEEYIVKIEIAFDKGGKV